MMAAKIQLIGIGASPGKVAGRIKRVNTLSDLQQVNSSTIILLEDSWPGVALGLLRARGLVIEFGDRVSHAAIMAAEMGKPCVVGVHKATELLQDSMMVELDGSEGTINEH